MHRALLPVVLSLSILISSLVAAQDAEYTFTTIDAPGAGATTAFGINMASQIVGQFIDGRQSSTGSAADLIVIGDVHTMDASAPKAEAIAVAGGRLVFVGDARQARALLRPGGRTIELAP